MLKVNWVPIGAGKLALSHRPNRKTMPSLAQLGCHRIVTLLSEAEGGLRVGEAIQKLGIAWTWVPLRNGRYPQGEAHERLAAAVPMVSQFLDDGEAVLVHCAAGIHRTGMLTLAVLLWRGYSEPEALEIISQLRLYTREGLQLRQFMWARKFIEDHRALSISETASEAVPPPSSEIETGAQDDES